LFITVFGFAIPSGATITGIEVEVEGNGANATAANRSIAIGMTKDGTTLAGSRLATQNLPQTTDGVLTFGNSTNLFSTTLTAAEVNASTWGIMLRAGNTNTGQRAIDRVRVRVYFNRANGPLGSNWGNAPFATEAQITGNVVTASSFNDHVCQWIADAFGNDQFSQATMTAIDPDGASYMGVIARGSLTDYVVAQQIEDTGGCAIVWYNGGAYTVIADDTAGLLSPGDVVKLEAEGTTFRMYVNGALRLSGSNGSAPASGQPGILLSNDGDQIDTWSGGNLSALAASNTGFLGFLM
jgi:hypothetical protein